MAKNSSEGKPAQLDGTEMEEEEEETEDEREEDDEEDEEDAGVVEALPVFD